MKLSGLGRLESILLHENAIRSLGSVSFAQMPMLSNVRLDKNNMSRIRDGELDAICSGNLMRSLSLVGNGIEKM